MRRDLMIRLVALWVAFGLGTGVGALITAHYLGKCDVRLVDTDTDALINAAQAALPAAMTGGGAVSFSFNPVAIHVHADSAFENQDYDSEIPAVVRGAPVTVEVSTQLLRRMLSR
jgi:hypothetical protein